MSDKLKDSIDTFFDKDVFLPTKTIVLTGSVDDDMYDTALKGIHALDSVNGEITIKLKSDGGEVEVARAIYDLIAGAKNVVRIQCYGNVESAATLILQAADVRCMSENAKLMLHTGEEGISSNHPKNVERQYIENREEEKWMENVYLSRIKEKKKRFTRQKLKEMLDWDTYISPKEALELGLIDQIGELQ